MMLTIINTTACMRLQSLAILTAEHYDRIFLDITVSLRSSYFRSTLVFASTEQASVSSSNNSLRGIPDTFQFWYKAALFEPVDSTPKVCKCVTK